MSSLFIWDLVFIFMLYSTIWSTIVMIQYLRLTVFQLMIFIFVIWIVLLLFGYHCFTTLLCTIHLTCWAFKFFIRPMEFRPSYFYTILAVDSSYAAWFRRASIGLPISSGSYCFIPGCTSDRFCSSFFRQFFLWLRHKCIVRMVLWELRVLGPVFSPTRRWLINLIYNVSMAILV